MEIRSLNEGIYWKVQTAIFKDTLVQYEERGRTRKFYEIDREMEDVFVLFVGHRRNVCDVFSELI